MSLTPTPITVDSILAEVSRRVATSPAARSINGVYHFRFTNGAPPRTIHIAQGRVTPLNPNGVMPPNVPAVTIHLTTGDLIAIATRQMDPMRAYMSGRVKVQGPIGLLIKLGPLLG